jgi:carbohydrate binding protein with CBM11 domain
MKKMLFYIVIIIFATCNSVFCSYASRPSQSDDFTVLDDFETSTQWISSTPQSDSKPSLQLSNDAISGEKSLLISYYQESGWMQVKSQFDFEIPKVNDDYEAILSFWVKGDASDNKIKLYLVPVGKKSRGHAGPFILRTSEWEKISLPLNYFTGYRPKKGRKYTLNIFFENIQGSTSFNIDDMQLEWRQKTPPKEIHKNSDQLSKTALHLLTPRQRLIDNAAYTAYSKEIATGTKTVYKPFFHLIPFTELETPFIVNNSNSVPFHKNRLFRLVKNDASITYKFSLHQNLPLKVGIHTGGYGPQGDPGKYKVLLSSNGIDFTEVIDSSDSNTMNTLHPTYQEVDASGFLITGDDLYVQFAGPAGVLRDITLLAPIPDDNTNSEKKTPSHTFYQTSASWTNYYLPGRDMLTNDVCIAGFKADMYTSYRDNNYDTIGIMAAIKPESIKPSSTDAGKRQLIKDAVTIGADYVMFEEPFFRRSGTDSQEFKELWTELFNIPWQDPASSIDNRYKLEKMRTVYWQRRIEEFGNLLRQYNTELNRSAKFYIATHSPLNYRQWHLSFPHAQTLFSPVIDAIIGQVWSDTSRQNIVYQGRSQERTFDYAFMEYSYFYNLFQGTDKGLWFLHDPASDIISWERRSWNDYQRWYEGTLLASLFFPEIDTFEVLPWPERIFMWKDLNGELAPMAYRMEILSAIRALEDMHNQTSIAWDCGTTGIAIPIADSMGWQYNPHTNTLDSFFGIALPLFNAGIPIQTIPLERTIETGYIDQYKVLLLSYDMFKPLKADYNIAIAKWVKRGGTLIFFGGTDAYNDLDEWWTQAGFSSPQEHLLSLLNIDVSIMPLTTRNGSAVSVQSDNTFLPENLTVPTESLLTIYDAKKSTPLYTVNNKCVAFEARAGAGNVFVFGISPNTFSLSKELNTAMQNIVRYACEKSENTTWHAPGYLRLDRGKYTIAWAAEKTLVLDGKYIDILDPAFPLIENPVLTPGQGGLFVSLAKANTAGYIHSNSQITPVEQTDTELVFKTAGPSGTLGVTLVNTASSRPTNVTIQNALGATISYRISWDKKNSLLRIYYNHIPSASTITIQYHK